MTLASVTIIGLGLIGGSLGLALNQIPPGDRRIRVGGWDPDPSARGLALERGVVDQVFDSPEAAVAGVELVVVAVPVLSVPDVFRIIAPALDPQAVVTDVASTKAMVCGWAEEILPVSFIGGHPMAGSERSGVGNARADLFAGATYCLTPQSSTPGIALDRATALVEHVGAHPYVLDPELHDRAVAAISHLPFLLSIALVEATSSDPEWEVFRVLAASGFRDVSRLASGDTRMHHDICLTNARAIRARLIEVARSLEALAVELDDGPALLQRFEHAKSVRDELLANRPAILGRDRK